MSSDHDPAEVPRSEQTRRPTSWDEVSSVIDEPARSDIGDSTVEVAGLGSDAPPQPPVPPMPVPEASPPSDGPPAAPRGVLDPHGTSRPGVDMERALEAARLAEAPPEPVQKPTTARPETPMTPTVVVDATVPPKDALRWQPGEIKLVIEQGLSIGKEFLVSDGEMLIGRRDPDQDFIPDIDLFDQEAANNRYISRRQARLYFRDAQLFLLDLESSNGTAINNRLIAAHEPRLLKLGDKLLFGQSVLLRVKRV